MRLLLQRLVLAQDNIPDKAHIITVALLVLRLRVVVGTFARRLEKTVTADRPNRKPHHHLLDILQRSFNGAPDLVCLVDAVASVACYLTQDAGPL
jgi:hypothetical protein